MNEQLEVRIAAVKLGFDVRHVPGYENHSIYDKASIHSHGKNLSGFSNNCYKTLLRLKDLLEETAYSAKNMSCKREVENKLQLFRKSLAGYSNNSVRWLRLLLRELLIRVDNK